MSDRLTHLDEHGHAHMVDVGDKPITRRECVARAEVQMAPETLARIAQVRFYDDREERLLEAMQTFAEQNVRFLVFGRMAERYLTLADLELPPQLRALCQEVTEDEFRMDISSTELRQAGGE